MSRSAALFSIAVVLAAGACGGSADSVPTPDSVETITTLPPTDSVPPVTFLSEPVEGGALLGSGRNQEQFDAASEAPPEPCVDGQAECDDIDPNQPRPPDVVEPRPPFVPAAGDAPFCSLLEDLENRPFPSDEFEAVVVMQAWFLELAPTVPAEYQADFAVLNEWLDQAVKAQGQMTFDDEFSDEVDDASNRLGEYVDSNCYGFGLDRDLGPPTTEVPTTDVPLDIVPLDELGQLPPVDFDSDPEPTGPLFGEIARESADEFGVVATNGFEPSVEHAAFCALHDEMSTRPFPTDETEEIMVAQVWLREIAPLVPAEISEDVSVVVAWIDLVAADGVFNEENEPALGGRVFDALQMTDAFVDTNCYGF